MKRFFSNRKDVLFGLLLITLFVFLILNRQIFSNKQNQSQRKPTTVTQSSLDGDTSLAGKTSKLNEELIEAVIDGDAAKVKQIVEDGADINTVTDNEDFEGGTPIMISIATGNIEIVKLLVESGADVNSELNNEYVEGYTLLMMASTAGHLDIVEFLVDNGANVNAVAIGNNEAVTALILASQKGHSDIVKFLIDNGADVNKANQKTKTSKDSDIDKVNVKVPYIFEPNNVKNIYEKERIFVEESTGLKKKIIDLGDEISIELAYIRAGEFKMGSPDVNVTAANYFARPQHKVKFSKGFWMGIYEVTNGQYQQFVKESNYDGKRESNANYLMHLRDTSQGSGSDYPVIWISWNNAMAFCKWLSVKEGRTYRLPTEAEWEYACRAGLDAPLDIEDDGLFISSSGGRAESMRRTHPAGQGTPNEYSLYDMYDNVREWCLDWFGLYSEDAQIDPKGPESGDRRVVRSGYSGNIMSFDYTNRNNEIPNTPSHAIGFRIICEDSE
jgi:formylglycine-generating enzyme required for sulfatase activity